MVGESQPFLDDEALSQLEDRMDYDLLVRADLTEEQDRRDR
jgi:hypothetical protein